MQTKQSRSQSLPLLILVILIFVQVSSCSSLWSGSGTGGSISYPTAEVVFQVNLPEPLETGSKLVLEVLDDVTGLYFNASRYEMTQKEGLTYFTHVPFAISSEMKYRYVKVGSSTDYEYTPQNNQVRYRILKVSGPVLVQDMISAWVDGKYNGPLGRIQGQIIDKTSKVPIPDRLVCAGGLQTVTSSDGSYILDGLKPGIHNLVIYSMDGAYETFQQGARISDEATTPAIVYLEKRDTVNLTINVKIPQDYDESLPLRFVSNLLPLGNAYADLSSGSTGSAVNYPALQKLSTTEYRIKLTVPKGFFLRYKFSLGDGFWNSELDENGDFVIRDLIADQTTTITNKILTFKAEAYESINFVTEIPQTTPATDTIYIQFNPFGWMEPLPMVADGNNRWHFTLYNPMHMLGDVQYRFCRNGLCDIAGDQSKEIGHVAGTNEIQNIAVKIVSWRNLTDSSPAFSLVTEGGARQPRPTFITGVELVQTNPSNWQSLIDLGLSSSSGYGGDYVILTPTWSATSINPPLLEAVPGRDLLWNELQIQNSHIILNGQKTILYPQINYTNTSDIFWMSSEKNNSWWSSWFDRYQRFILSYANLANLLKMEAIIIGEPSLSPTMTGGLLPDGTSSNVPEIADDQWRKLISDIRSRFSGSVIGIASISSDSDHIPGWLDKVDSIYVLFSPAVMKGKAGTVIDIKQELNQALNQRVLPIYEKYNKPILIGLSYPSNDYAIGGYTSADKDHISTPAEVIDVTSNLDLQAMFYNAALISVSSKDWISGFISRGYYPYVTLQDASSSVNGKPAGDVLWFWYHFLLNKAP